MNEIDVLRNEKNLWVFLFHGDSLLNQIGLLTKHLL